MAEYDAGAGRGKQGGPTVKELDDYERKQNAGIYTADKGKPPQDKDGGSAPIKKPMPAPRYKSGGSVSSASRRADGCAQRGKTRA